jgi:hypothetical protein
MGILNPDSTPEEDAAYLAATNEAKQRIEDTIIADAARVKLISEVPPTSTE